MVETPAERRCSYKKGKAIYSTSMELNFITGLARKGRDRLLLYAKTARARHRWGTIDREKVLDHLEALLKL